MPKMYVIFRQGYDFWENDLVYSLEKPCSWGCKGSYMLYLKNRKGYRHALGTKKSGMPNFIFNVNPFMGLKVNASWVIKEKPCFWADILDFEGLASIFELGIQKIWIQHALIPLESMYAINAHDLPSGSWFLGKWPSLRDAKVQVVKCHI